MRCLGPSPRPCPSGRTSASCAIGLDEALFERLAVHIRQRDRQGKLYERVIVYYEETGLACS